MSDDGRFVAFASSATDLVPGDPAAQSSINVYLWDRATKATVRLTDGDGWSATPAISGDGNFVAFTSLAGLVPDDTNGDWDLYVLSRLTGEFHQITDGDVCCYAMSTHYSLSYDGRYLAFTTKASNLVPGDDVYARADVFLWDRESDEVTQIVKSLGNSYRPSISADGAYVAFASEDDRLAPGSQDDYLTAYVWSRATGQVVRVAKLDSTPGLRISADGRYVSYASYYTPESPTYAGSFIYSWDRVTKDHVLVMGTPAEVGYPHMTPDGQSILFGGTLPDLRTGWFVWNRSTGAVIQRFADDTHGWDFRVSNDHLTYITYGAYQPENQYTPEVLVTGDLRGAP